MSRKLFFVFIIFILLSSLLYVELNPVVVESTTDYPVENDDTGSLYSTIQEAINAWETFDGHSLSLKNIVFYEHVVVNKSVKLIGSISIEHPEFVTTINGDGTGTVVTVEADNVIMHCIKIMNGINGIYLEGTDNSALRGLDVVDNAVTGIYLYNSRNCTLEYNDITGSIYGIYLQNSNNNTIYYNNFIDNTYQVHVGAIDGYPSNTWDDSASKGNYWSDYEDRYPDAEEIDGTGIWDTPYVIDENNVDNYPIVPEFPTWTSMLLILVMLTVPIAIYKRRLLKTPIH